MCIFKWHCYEMDSLLLSDSGSFIAFLIKWGDFQISTVVVLSILQNKLCLWPIGERIGLECPVESPELLSSHCMQSSWSKYTAVWPKNETLSPWYLNAYECSIWSFLWYNFSFDVCGIERNTGFGILNSYKGNLPEVYQIMVIYNVFWELFNQEYFILNTCF